MNPRGQRITAATIDAWNEPDQFDWITAFLSERGLLVWARRMLSAVAASAALIPVTGLVCERSPAAFLVAQLVGLALAATMALFWLARWPTRRQSQTAVVLGLVCIAAWSQAQLNPEQSVPICMAAAITGGYMAFFHSTRLMVINFVVALALATATTYRLDRATEVMSAARAFWLIWLFNLAIPLSVWGALRAIRAFVTRSNEDPLTGLLNRRAFIPAVLADLTVGSSGHDNHLTVAMIDLDNFKSVNDTYGHIAGDNTLIAVADLLRHHAGTDAAICRAGGEEFLVALICDSAHPAPLAARLCQQIAGLSPPTTASIGTVSVTLASAPIPATASFIEQLIIDADKAMYSAKRNGGNHARHTTHTPVQVDKQSAR